MDGFWFVFVRLRVTVEPETIQPISNNSWGTALPSGALTSQYFANHYLSSLNHYVKERLSIPGYVRYMDDFVL
ncbi:MAG: hypothetical protein ACI8T1_001244 [Verrucomicrobiales bacterium]|jgi:hypothetical protein